MSSRDVIKNSLARSTAPLLFMVSVAVNGTVVASTDMSAVNGLYAPSDKQNEQGCPVETNGKEQEDTGWALIIDNDAFLLGSTRDRDYTGGMAFTMSGRGVLDNWLSLDSGLGVIDDLLGVSDELAVAQGRQIHALQAGLLVFTPGDIGHTKPIIDDRPFANLLYVSSSRQVISPDGQYVTESDLSVGILGTRLGENMQRAIHRVIGAEEPKGTDFQISKGGEPTLRYTLGRQTLIDGNSDSAGLQHDIKYNVDVSVGYITDVSVSTTFRFGLINSPWWSFTPEKADYISEATSVIGSKVNAIKNELYIFMGAKTRLRLYNALLQGQFRDSAVTFDMDELERVIHEAWAGVTWQLDARTRISYQHRFQTNEIRHGTGSRHLLWAGLIFSRSL